MNHKTIIEQIDQRINELEAKSMELNKELARTEDELLSLLSLRDSNKRARKKLRKAEGQLPVFDPAKHAGDREGF